MKRDMGKKAYFFNYMENAQGESQCILKQNLQGQSSRLRLEIYVYTENQEPFPARISTITPEVSSTNILLVHQASSLSGISALPLRIICYNSSHDHALPCSSPSRTTRTLRSCDYSSTSDRIDFQPHFISHQQPLPPVIQIVEIGFSPHSLPSP